MVAQTKVMKKEYDRTSSLQELMEGIRTRCQPFYPQSALAVVLEDGRAALKGWPTSTDTIAWVEPGAGMLVTYGVGDDFDLIEKTVGNEIDRFSAATGAIFSLELIA